MADGSRVTDVGLHWHRPRLIDYVSPKSGDTVKCGHVFDGCGMNFKVY